MGDKLCIMEVSASVYSQEAMDVSSTPIPPKLIVIGCMKLPIAKVH
ncbi:hypothetical protein [Niameybacter sp.]